MSFQEYKQKSEKVYSKLNQDIEQLNLTLILKEKVIKDLIDQSDGLMNNYHNQFDKELATAYET